MPEFSSVVLLRNVTLGVSRGEIDFLVAGVHDIDGNFTTTELEGGEWYEATVHQHTKRGKLQSSSTALDAVVLAIVEVKRCVDDLSYAVFTKHELVRSFGRMAFLSCR